MKVSHSLDPVRMNLKRDSARYWEEAERKENGLRIGYLKKRA